MMTSYQLTHQHTADLHYCGPDSAGRPIIVDVAEITAGHFEIAAFWGNGDEIESDEVEDIDTARRLYSELLRKLVPKALVIPLSEEVGAHSKNYIRKITPEQIERLVKLLKGMVFPISDYAPFEYAVVTAGGVSCEDVNRYTMESLKVKGLYFAGEVLDLDANTGGYNLQIAFSTGRLAGMLKQ